eukprot:jgi/Tetstr1/423447/TSEL_014128.t1
MRDRDHVLLRRAGRRRGAGSRARAAVRESLPPDDARRLKNALAATDGGDGFWHASACPLGLRECMSAPRTPDPRDPLDTPTHRLAALLTLGSLARNNPDVAERFAAFAPYGWELWRAAPLVRRGCILSCALAAAWEVLGPPPPPASPRTQQTGAGGAPEPMSLEDAAAVVGAVLAAGFVAEDSAARALRLARCILEAADQDRAVAFTNLDFAAEAALVFGAAEAEAVLGFGAALGFDAADAALALDAAAADATMNVDAAAADAALGFDAGLVADAGRFADAARGAGVALPPPAVAGRARGRHGPRSSM